MAATCICREPNSFDHTLICKRGPFVDYRHNRLRDVIAELLNTCLPKVSTEPPLLQVTAESLPRGTTLEPGARQEFLPEVSTHQCNEHFYVRVSNPGAPTHSVYETPAKMYAAHEKEK